MNKTCVPFCEFQRFDYLNNGDYWCIYYDEILQMEYDKLNKKLNILRHPQCIKDDLVFAKEKTLKDLKEVTK